MYDTTVQGVLQVHVTCVTIPTMDRLVSGSKLVTFPFKSSSSSSSYTLLYVYSLFIVSHKQQLKPL